MLVLTVTEMQVYVCFVIITSVIVDSVVAHNNNVCKTFPDYYTDRNLNENCYYNPDGTLAVPDIIKRHGYPVEIYNVTTIDGYILTIFRIPYGKSAVDSNPGPPVFLQHGLALNCACFVARGNKSLGFILADQGYDVWLGNFRGTLYSKNHTFLITSDRAYWNFSFNENGIYDLPAMFDLVYSINSQKIIYIGFSMGTTAAYIYGVTYPAAAFEKLKIIISLAPVAFLRHEKGIIKYLHPIWRIQEPVVEELTNGQLMLHQPKLIEIVCLPYPLQMKFCLFPVMASTGFDYEQADPESLPITLLQILDDMSVKTFTHYTQFTLSGKFQNFDYGTAGNLQKYGSPAVPQYDLSKMKVLNYLIRGPNDFVATRKYDQSDYVLKYERTEAVWDDNDNVRHLKIVTFKHNRTCAISNATGIFTKDFNNEMRVQVQAYMFLSNEYREFPMRFEFNFCGALRKNDFGLGDFLACGNFSRCPLKKGAFLICNWKPNPSKFPPHFPNGGYMIELTAIFRSKEIMLMKIYFSVDRPIPWY